jgi:hypothetical protein
MCLPSLFCGVPDTVSTDAGAPTLFVRLKVADVATPTTDAVTLKLPGVPLARVSPLSLVR